MPEPTTKLRRTICGLKICERLKPTSSEATYFVADRFDNHLQDFSRYAKAVRFAKDKNIVGKATEGEDCPKCPNQGWFMERDHRGDPEPVQCQFCHTNPKSKFNLEQQAKTNGASG